MLRLRLKRKWGDYGAGSVVDFGEDKGRPLVADGTAIEVRKDEKLVHIKVDGNSLIRLKLLKKWGDYNEGSVVDFGESKGRPLITAGIAEEASMKEKKIIVKSEKKKRPKVEVAMIEPDAETTEITPKTRRRGRPSKGEK